MVPLNDRGTMKPKCYAENPMRIQELKPEIHGAIAEIRLEAIQIVLEN